MTHKQIIINLIKDHLANERLVTGLNALGLYSEEYQLNISDSIFKLIGISDENDELFEAYLQWCTKISQTEILADPKLLNTYATEIYLFLVKEAGC